MIWEEGRQGTGYLKKLLGQGDWWDLWVLKYPPGSYVPVHVDPVVAREHFRLNLVLWGEQTFRAFDPVLFQLGPLVLFRPDRTRHAVTDSKRVRYVLSLGWVRR